MTAPLRAADDADDTHDEGSALPPPRPAVEELVGTTSYRRRQTLNWDAIARGMPDFFDAASTRSYRRAEIALIRREIGDLRGLRVLKLDLWNEAINTRILFWMRAQGAEAFGLDLSHEVARRARRRAPGGRPLPVARADIRELPYPDDSFDFVYTMGTIEHIDEYRQAIAEIRRVLAPGGRAIIGVPHRWDPFLRPLLVAVLDRFGRYAYSPEKSFGYGELRRDAEEAGLRVLRRAGILVLPGLLRIADLWAHTRGHRRLARLTAALVRPFQHAELAWGWGRRLGYLVAVVAEKPASPAPERVRSGRRGR